MQPEPKPLSLFDDHALVSQRLRARHSPSPGERSPGPISGQAAVAAGELEIPKLDIPEPSNPPRTVSSHGPIGRRGAKVTTPAAVEVLERLSREIDKLQTSSSAQPKQPALSTGAAALDACLPHGGYIPGSVVEYLRLTPACGATYLALTAAASAMRSTGGFLVVVDPLAQIYPPALASHGIDLSKVVVVRPESQADAIWAIDQALRTPAVAVVVSELLRLDDRSARRLQLAAERGRGLGLLLRSAGARKSPSWAEIQWLVRSVARQPQLRQRNTASGQSSQSGWRNVARQLYVQLARVRGSNPGETIRLDIDGVTGALRPAENSSAVKAASERKRHDRPPQPVPRPDLMHLASQLASSTRPSRPAAAG